MRLSELVQALNLQVRSAPERLDAEVKGGYASDLMSDVIANAREGSVWVTLQTHVNIVAVAAMKELAGIILVNGREPQGETMEKGKEKKIPILVSSLPAFELIGRLHALGLPGPGVDAEGI